MTTIVDTIAAIVRHELAAVRSTELGVVEAVYPHTSADDDDNYGVDVALKNSGLLLKRVPVGTGHVGTVGIPNVGDLVLVAFDHGDVNAPLVIARFYDDADRPPRSTTDEIVLRLPLDADDDASVLAALRNHPTDDPARELIIEMPPKITVRIVDGTVTATAGQTELRLDQSGASGGTVQVKSGATTVTLDQDGDATLTSAASVTLQASGDLTLQAGGSIALDAGTSLTARAGTTAELAGGLSATVRGGTGVTVQGVSVSINGLTSFGP
ncbi:phage baseplate assembly protein V [Occultella aeris]|uniref:Phage-related baseplate assembly protein n=1 Tax=Occultella aeris TaxID=2761496 RepID=A0A7M4DGP1_9MICO|nr:phage baseplate assembly protein V [Occultella aeris]VZO36084.1 Phage-related baseplate assembly protein [Occultella aeris]